MIAYFHFLGLVMSSFSVSSIVGVPAGLYVADYYSWHVPFYAIAALSAIIVVIAAVITPPLRGHLLHIHEDHPVARTWRVMTHPDHQKAYIFMAALTCAGFLIFSYIPTYMVRNVGLTKEQLPLIYLFGGICTVFRLAASMALMRRCAAAVCRCGDRRTASAPRCPGGARRGTRRVRPAR